MGGELFGSDALHQKFKLAKTKAEAGTVQPADLAELRRYRWLRPPAFENEIKDLFEHVKGLAKAGVKTVSGIAATKAKAKKGDNAVAKALSMFK